MQITKKFIFLLLVWMTNAAWAEDLFLKSTYERAQSSHPLIAIAAHYDASRLQYLSLVLSSLSTFPRATIVIFTNTFQEQQLANIRQVCSATLCNQEKEISIEVLSCQVDHPYHLTWSHKEMIKNEFLNNERYSHFIYLEDDMELSFDNFLYFLEYRELLRDKHLLPSLLRVEYHSGFNDFTSTDQPGPIKIHERPHFDLGDIIFINMPNPYMACFILDQELAVEYVNSLSFDIDQSYFRIGWKERERSAMGLCFENIPKTFHSRYVVSVDKKTNIAPKCVWIRHLPNNYADHPTTDYGKRRMSELFVP